MTAFVLPSYVNGAPTWLEEADPEIVRQLKEGDPTIGWEGDERLFIRRNEYTGGWSVWRLGENGVEYCICNSKAPHKLDKSLLVRLRDHDTRKVDVVARIEKQNDAAQKAKDQATYEKNYQMMEKLYWAAGKDLGNNA